MLNIHNSFSTPGGGHEKSTIAIAFTTTMLAWGAIDYEAAYREAGEYIDVVKLIKTNARYLIRCHTSEDELVVQVYAKHCECTSAIAWNVFLLAYRMMPSKCFKAKHMATLG